MVDFRMSEITAHNIWLLLVINKSREFIRILKYERRKSIRADADLNFELSEWPIKANGAMLHLDLRIQYTLNSGLQWNCVSLFEGCFC